MAGRVHVDDSVIERRLRPLRGTNKKAVQEADKVLRKQPALHCARVLKGLALLRLGRRGECEALVAAVTKDAPTDEATLQALTICYREMHTPDQICRVYENAVKGEPGNEELLSHLFMSYVRVGDYKNQHQAAMKLYKLKPKNPYYFWAVMSHVMQAHKLGDAKSKEVCLLLAERMVNNFVKNGKIEAEAEVMTYLHILETQGKYEEALAVVDGPLASRVIHQPGNFLPLRRAHYHTRLKHWAQAATVYRDLITQEPDNWQHYVEYIRSVIHLTTEASPAEDPIAEAAEFLSGVRRKAVEERNKDRGPVLGLLQLAKALQEAGWGGRIEALCGDPLDLLLSYIEGYGDKMCCYGDLVNFLALVPGARVGELLGRVRALCRLSASGVPLDETHTANENPAFANGVVKTPTTALNTGRKMVTRISGATGAARGVYERCDMKHIQLDTLGHVLALQALDTGSYTTAAAIFSNTLKFFMANYKDTSDPLISSYKYGSLTRIPEFVEFRERLSNSLHFATVTAEQMLLDLTSDVSSHGQLVEAVQQMDIDPATDRTDWHHLTDNRDLAVMNTWEPPHRCLQEEDIVASVAADTALLRLRNLTLRLVGAACALTHPPHHHNTLSSTANKENR
ncbi:N-alpha-acetyltransferase 25, NatB auxiliary subunit [Chionoecetes opilio]|uniref:N-terminal acetyltransferase B complex subunit MDM20 homolog n=1 Tax=Chionoecetes opilio TaxID=41210 RepID=A0A8J4XQS8_CHIOP|nr:N-alpha-acetyltransferase 25, NatB auxiliary subunit [Chionoecetes opilio]